MRSSSILVLAVTLSFAACKSEDDDRPSSSPKPAVTTTPPPGGASSTETSPVATIGTLSFSIEGQVTPMEGLGPQSAANAAIAVAGHPELATTTDAQGRFGITAQPGVVDIYVTAADGAALTESPAAYGLKFGKVVVKAGEKTDLGVNALKATGAVTGDVRFLDPSQSAPLVGTDVYVPGTQLIAKTDDAGNFALAGMPVGEYELQIERTGFAPVRLKGVAVAEGATTPLPAVLLSVSGGPEGALAVTATSTPTIGGKAVKVSNAHKVQLALAYNSEAALMKIADEPSFLDKKWESVAPAYEWTFDSDGRKTLYVKFSDLNGLESSPYADVVVVDTEAPALGEVKILNGWAVAAKPEVFVDALATDAGTGIAEVAYAFAEGDLAAASWSAFAPRLFLSLPAAAGPKRLYVKVRDHVGRESNVAADSINLGTMTEILPTTYPGDLKLTAAQSPYNLRGAAVVMGDLTIEPGVTFYFHSTASTDGVDVRGKIMAIGEATAGKSITFDLNAAVSCSISPGRILNINAAPGTSEGTRIEHASFRRMSLSLNGGRVARSSFDGDFDGCPGVPGGIIEKHGFDDLTVTENTFTHWGNALYVRSGVGNTRFVGNSGTVAAALAQDRDATGTTYTGNTLTNDFYAGLGGGMISVTSGAMDFASNTFSTLGTAVYGNSAEDVTVSGVHFKSCANVVVNESYEPVGKLTITNSRFDACAKGITAALSPYQGAVEIDRSDVNVSTALASAITTQPSSSWTFRNSELKCGFPLQASYCDLLLRDASGGAPSILENNSSTPYIDVYQLIGNNIDCPVGVCRGVTLLNGAARVFYAQVTGPFTNNYWYGRSAVFGSSFTSDIRMANSALGQAQGAIRAFTFSGTAIPDLNATFSISSTSAGEPNVGAGAP